MLGFYNNENVDVHVRFCAENEQNCSFSGCPGLFAGKYLQIAFFPHKEQTVLLVGCGDNQKPCIHEIKELCAAAAKALKAAEVTSCVADIALFWQTMGESALSPITLGFVLGAYQFNSGFLLNEQTPPCNILLSGIENTMQNAECLKRAWMLSRGVLFAKNTVNCPGNLLHPMDFERVSLRFLENSPIESKLFVLGELRASGLNLLSSVGASSEYPPCLLVLRYRGGAPDTPCAVLVGKGVTCDTGGYCLKASSSMAGIKGDMAGAAAVIGAMYALAENHIPVNVTAYLPLCENRISSSSILPGDVLRAYNGTTVEILNTDAEGRLILADTVAFAIKQEAPACIIDIATLTGAVWAVLGYTITGVLCDDEPLYEAYAKASACSAERHLRLPFGIEHRKMLESTVADLKNTGSDCCGTITAGLFIREFADGLPWLHLDIAGTAWVQTPNYAFEQPGATGVGVVTLYELMKGLF